MSTNLFRTVFAFVMAATFAFAPASFAAMNYESSFKALDTNGDSYVDRDEFIANFEGMDAEKTFDQIDKDKSGFIDMSEWKAYKESEDKGDGGMMKKSE